MSNADSITVNVTGATREDLFNQAVKAGRSFFGMTDLYIAPIHATPYIWDHGTVTMWQADVEVSPDLTWRPPPV